MNCNLNNSSGTMRNFIFARLISISLVSANFLLAFVCFVVVRPQLESS